MIKKIRNSLTIKICVLVMFLLLACSGVTYAAIIRFLPAYYSNQLQKDIDTVSQGMIETIQSYKTIEEASRAIELFEAGSQVSVIILDKQGEQVWPAEEATAERTVPEDSVIEEIQLYDVVAGFEDSAVKQTQDAAAAVPEDGAAMETAAGDFLEATAKEDMVVTEEKIAVTTVAKSYENNSAVKQYRLELGGQNYTMLVFGGMQPVNQAIEILRQIFPYIFGISILAAMLFSAGASFYLTMPIVKLSRVSKRMAALDFDSLYQGKRTDEIGTLGTDLNEMSQNLSCALKELKEANTRLKWDIDREREIEKKRIAFFSAVSHELKTPITILKGHLAGMLQGIGQYQNRDYYLQRSQEAAEKMEEMVKELLTVSRIESRTFLTQPADIAELLRQKIADMAELIENKSLNLTVSIPDHLHAQVNSGMMEKVFSNLLMNAVRYTPEGNGNEIRVTLQAGKTGGRAAECRIENTGVNIPEQALPQLFEPFYRVEQSRNRQSGGSGLGLYIVKMILEQHGAEYRICNTRDGVSFFFSL